MRQLRRLFGLTKQNRDDAPAPAASGSKTSVSRDNPPSLERESAISRAAACDAERRYAQSLALTRQALASTPDNPELLFARASTLYDWGRVREALEVYLRVQSVGFTHSALPLQIGWCYLRLAKPEQAEARMREASHLDSNSTNILFGLGAALQARKRFDEAIVAFENCLRQDADDFPYLISLAHCKSEQKDYVGAEDYVRRAISVDAKQATGWNRLGVVLGYQRRHAEALVALETAERLETIDDDGLDNFVNLAGALRNMGRVDDAIALCERHLPARPTVPAHGNYALSLLTAGRLREGWQQFDFRWPGDLLPSRPPFVAPAWAGQDLHGKTVLLRFEQGIGDTIQCARYVPNVKALGATVLMQVHAELLTSALRFPGVDGMFGPNAPLTGFDFYIHLFALPRIFGTELDSIPADIPYLHPEPVLAQRWGNRLAAERTLKIGLMWAGNPRHTGDRSRSIALSMLTPLLEIEGVQFFSLQKGPAAEQVDGCPAAATMIKLGPELGDFGDTAAVISHLDLVLCVDTAVAHLAGAMGKPVWLLVAQPSDWRWLQEREDTPWYPTMRLFRQRTRDDWDEVLARVKSALEQWAGGDSSVLPPQSQHAGQANAKPKPLTDPVWAGHRRGLSAVAETRMGIVQYLPDELEVGAAIGWYGEYLQPQVDLLVQMIRPGATVMEVGAGVGTHALPLAAAVGATGHLMLYETRPVMRRILQQNLAANGVTNATLMRRSLGVAEASHGVAASGVPEAVSTVAQAWPSSESLDELQLERLDGLKISAEVATMQVLEGATETLWRLRPWMFIAAAGEPMVEELSRWAKGFGYRCWRMETRLFNGRNFNRRDDDIFGGRSALALFALPEEIEIGVGLAGCVELP